jgi:hypothetical protein
MTSCPPYAGVSNMRSRPYRGSAMQEWQRRQDDLHYRRRLKTARQEDSRVQHFIPTRLARPRPQWDRDRAFRRQLELERARLADLMETARRSRDPAVFAHRDPILPHYSKAELSPQIFLSPRRKTRKTRKTTGRRRNKKKKTSKRHALERAQAEHALYDAVANGSSPCVPSVPTPPSPRPCLVPPPTSPLRRRRRYNNTTTAKSEKNKNIKNVTGGFGSVDMETEDEFWKLPASSYLNKPAVMDILRASVDAETKKIDAYERRARQRRQERRRNGRRRAGQMRGRLEIGRAGIDKEDGEEGEEGEEEEEEPEGEYLNSAGVQSLQRELLPL